jgi:N-carbamoyl-L-amino-acid hydrolase
MLAGVLDADRLASLSDRDGHGLGHWVRKAGLEGEVGISNERERVEAVRLPPNVYAAFLELHIEQGPILEQENVPIGIVEKIAAPSTLRINLTGVGGHAGAVLMPDRHDALLAGAEIALAVERAALDTGSPDTVATTGVFRIEPGAVNSVPCRAWLEIDVRDTLLPTRDQALNQIESSAVEICNRRRIEFRTERLNVDAPANCDPQIVGAMESVSNHLNLRSKRMISRAYHDSLFMAQVCPTAMIFIPCRGGVSHRPDEFSSPEQIRTGVEVLAHTLGRLAA